MGFYTVTNVESKWKIIEGQAFKYFTIKNWKPRKTKSFGLIEMILFAYKTV